MRTKPGQRTLPFLSCSFRESSSITMTSRRLRIPMTLEQRGRTSRYKVSIRGWWCTGWKDSITSAHAKNSGYPMSFKSKRWPQSADPDRKKYFLKSCRRAKARMIGASFPKAFLKVLFTQVNKACKTLWHPVTIVAYERKHALNQI